MCIDTLTEAGGKTLAFPQNLEEFPPRKYPVLLPLSPPTWRPEACKWEKLPSKSLELEHVYFEMNFQMVFLNAKQPEQEAHWSLIPTSGGPTWIGRV